ncbi:MAG: tRNA pseudouridine(55) synthase TruB [Gemmatimonadales bacterium]
MIAAASDFVLPVDKPEGPTSHDVVRAARKAVGNRRIGHTGTLDPFASGLLLLCVGKATRLAEYLAGQDKTYEAVALLGATTATLDPEGEVLERRSGWESLDRTRIEAVLERFRGDVDQVPPEYSAKKIDGVAAHRRVRRGETVLLRPVRVRISSLALTGLDLPRITLRLTCSSGTYVRALARDIGEALGVGAHLEKLRRTAIGDLSVADALAYEDLADPERVAGAALAPLDALGHLPALDVDDDVLARIMHGSSVTVEGDARDGTVLLAHGGNLVAIGEREHGVVHPRKVFGP